MSRTVADITVANNATINGVLTTDDIDAVTATTLLIGKAIATKVEIADVGVDTTIAGDAFVTGNLTVSGTTTTVDSTNVNYTDNHLYLNNGYTTVVAETGGLVVNYLPITTGAAVAATGFVAGVSAVSNPTVVTDNTVTFATGEFIQISGAADPTNNGLFEVSSYANPTLTIRGVGTSATVEDFTQNQFVTDTTVQGSIFRINISVMRAGTDGLWETASGSSTGLTFTDVTSGGVSRFESTTNNRIARWDGADTDSIKNSLVLIDDTTGTVNIEAAAGIYEINSDSVVAYDATRYNLALGPTGMTLTTAGVTDNIAIGTGVLSAVLASGAVGNVGIGDGVLVANTTGARNIGVGVSGLAANTTGSDNIGLGNQALDAVTTGDSNVAIGTDAIGAMTVFSNNVAVGYNAMLSGAGAGVAQQITTETLAESTGIDGTYFIFETTPTQQYYVWYDVNNSGTADPAPTAPAKITLTGIEVTTVTTGMTADQVATETRSAINGVLSGAATGATNQVDITNPVVGGVDWVDNLPNTSGFNTFVNISGQGAAENIGIGSEVLENITTGYANVAIGRWALGSLTGGDFVGFANTAIGYRSGVNLVGSSNYENTIIGTRAAESATSMRYCTIIGDRAGKNINTIGDSNIIIGDRAASDAVSLGSNNIIMGRSAGQSLLSASKQIIIGSVAADIATTMTDSMVIGTSAAGSATSIGTSTIIGSEAGSSVTALSASIIIGYRAAFNATDTDNCVIIGTSALESGISTGADLTVVGVGALFLNTSGARNTAIGFSSLNNNTIGSNNTALGDDAGRTNATGSGNTSLGQNADTDSAGSTERVAIGLNATATADYNIQLGQAVDAGSGVLNYRTQKVSDETWIAGGISGAIINNAGDIERGANTLVTNTVQTTDATVTTLSTIATATDTTYLLNIKVTSRRSDTGSESGGYFIKALFRNNGGTVTQVGVDDLLAFEDTVAWVVATSISTTNVLVRVTGEGGKTIQWISSIEVLDINVA